MDLSGRVALVTGASRGVGRATAEAFLAAGASVALAARDEAALEALAATAPERTLAAMADISNPAAVDALFAAIGRRFGRLDICFNNAGAAMFSTDFGDTDWADWRRVLSVNLDGAFLVARGAYRMMRDQRPRGGRIINNGSVSAQAPRPGSAAYTASKHAITGLTKSIALDGRAHDVACGQIDIGNAATDMTARMPEGVPQADGSVRPEPVMDAAHVAEAVLAMAALPLEANMPFVTVMATKMPLHGRG